MKKLAKMIKSSEKITKNIRSVNYFTDLQICSAFHMRFPAFSPRGTTLCRPNYFSLEMILYGEVILYLDQTPVHLKGPCVFWIGDHHKTFQFEVIRGKSYEHFWIDFSGERGRRIYESLCEAYPESFILLKTGEYFLPLFEKLIKKYRIARHPSSAPQDVLLLEEMMALLCTQKEENYEISDPYGLPYLVEMIKNTPFQGHDPRYFAASAGISYVYFRKKFKEFTGESFRQFVLKQQMLTAGEFLKSGKFRINELADYCNFPDLASFSRTFKRFYHQSPRAYLQQNKKSTYLLASPVPEKKK